MPSKKKKKKNEKREMSVDTKSQQIPKQIKCYSWVITTVSQSRICEEIRRIANFDTVAAPSLRTPNFWHKKPCRYASNFRCLSSESSSPV